MKLAPVVATGLLALTSTFADAIKPAAVLIDTPPTAEPG